MYITARPHGRRLKVEIHGSYRKDGKVCSRYFGMLGSVPLSATLADQRRFWSELDARLGVAAAKYPGLDAAQISKLKRSLAKHIPRPMKAVQEIAGRREPAVSKRSKGVRRVSA
jgi:hypothetical protein